MEKALGAILLIAALCRRPRYRWYRRSSLSDTRGCLCHSRLGDRGPGANRLSSPTPLVHIEDWARAWAAEEVFDLTSEVLNDDRIGRALDAIAPELAGIVCSIGARAIAEFGVEVASSIGV